MTTIETQIFTVVKNGVTYSCKIEDNLTEYTTYLFIELDGNWIRIDPTTKKPPFTLDEIPQSWKIKDGETIKI